VATVGVELSPVADALAGLRADEARHFRNMYVHVFPVDRANPILETEVAWLATGGLRPGETREADPARAHSW
jgi:hypothetical protein